MLRRARTACTDQAKTDKDRNDCNSYQQPDPQFERKYLKPAEVNRALFSGMWRAGFDGSVGINRFDFIDSTTIGKLHQTKFQFAVAAFVGIYPGDAVSAWIGRVEYQNAYKADDDTILCRSMIVDPAKDCARGAPKPPHKVEQVNLSLAYERVLDFGWKAGALGIAPKVTFDALSSHWSAELPIYFIPNRDWPVSPEVSASYSSEKDKFSVAFLLRATFSFD